MKTTGVGVALLLVALGAIPGRAAAQLSSDVVPLHSFADVPGLPRDVPALIKRYGDVATPDGTEKGDLATEAVRERIDGWMKRAGPPAMDYSAMAGAAGVMNPAVAEAIGELVQTATRMTTEISQAVQTFELTTLPPLQQAYEAQLDRIHKEYDPQIERCLTLSERAGGSSCTDPTPARNAAINAAGTAFLQTVEGQYHTYCDRLQAIAAEGEVAIDHASKVFGASTPAMAKGQIMIIRQNELTELTAALSAEQDVFLYVYGHAELPNDGQDTP
ncbi:MAG TPA: hypothetical protein VJ992_06280 [Gemmatimonadales bacterium]|nr:hypothetical protein [Gemmatimonadales bacterium]